MVGNNTIDASVVNDQQGLGQKGHKSKLAITAIMTVCALSLID
jgi:hypothetical protein